MEHSSTCSLIAGLTSLSLATIAQACVAAGTPDRPSEPPFAAERSAMTPAAPVARTFATHGSPLTLYVHGPTGNAFRLVYAPTHSWRAIDGWGSRRHPGNAKAEKVVQTETASGLTHASPGYDPLTVFVDGPTGFVFVWMTDVGWKFVGSVSDGHP